ncbi:DUF4350 domain-containing protein [Tannerella sp.]|uniref:DUF4350 domain-containing protein n=1 Tax=Tannerella sp. TaxID=2382127 RepID=UPI0026DCA27E|nr:DUF4350 domain-containing protein [Tannerella sp.]MDO4704327.1 hypothetical protein [Tannerella sp.]
MKGSKLYFVILGAFTALAFVFQYYSPKPFRWTPTFYHNDRQPFGCYVFDEVVGTSVVAYEVLNRSLYETYMASVDTSGLWEERKDSLMEDETYGIEEAEEYFGEEAWDNELDSIHFNEEESPFSAWNAEENILDLPEPELLPEADRRAILVVEEDLLMQSIDVKALYGLLRQGNKVMLCASWFSGALCDSLRFSTEYDPVFGLVRYFERSVKQTRQRDSLYWGADTLHAEAVYAVYPQTHPSYLHTGDDTLQIREQELSSEHDTLAKPRSDKMRCDSSRVLVCDGQGRPVAIQAYIGDGELFLVTTPLLFTNYGMLDGNNASYIFRLLSCMGPLPLIRLESYGSGAQESGSLFRVLLKHPPLRWALYTAALTLLLFMFFTARRRQRVIPVVQPPANGTLRFTQLIGRLYYQRKDYKEMIKKKYLYFCTDVKRLHGLDLQSGEPAETLNGRLARKMGLPAEEVWPAFRELNMLLHDDTRADEAAMIRHIDRINEWKSKLN